MIIFIEWPIILYELEILLGLLQIPYKILVADQSQNVRLRLVEEFNDPKDKERVFLIGRRYA
jgi:hypothetical protein